MIVMRGTRGEEEPPQDYSMTRIENEEQQRQPCSPAAVLLLSLGAFVCSLFECACVRRRCRQSLAEAATPRIHRRHHHQQQTERERERDAATSRCSSRVSYQASAHTQRDGVTLFSAALVEACLLLIRRTLMKARGHPLLRPPSLPSASLSPFPSSKQRAKSERRRRRVGREQEALAGRTRISKEGGKERREGKMNRSKLRQNLNFHSSTRASPLTLTLCSLTSARKQAASIRQGVTDVEAGRETREDCVLRWWRCLHLESAAAAAATAAAHHAPPATDTLS